MRTTSITKLSIMIQRRKVVEALSQPQSRLTAKLNRFHFHLCKQVLLTSWCKVTTFKTLSYPGHPRDNKSPLSTKMLTKKWLCNKHNLNQLSRRNRIRLSSNNKNQIKLLYLRQTNPSNKMLSSVSNLPAATSEPPRLITPDPGKILKWSLPLNPYHPMRT